ncbi:MAG: sugar transferase [Acidimicrobiia bacterium]|nr:sugar transferase [Acidimicrobiia bacterium]
MNGLVKRGIDLVGAVSGLVVLSPLLVLVAIAVRLTMGSPVIFTQTRPGLHGEPFEIRKFRTMRDATPGEDEVGTDAKRLTTLGRFLRSSSIDELPELVNILEGNMSLVGPRPLLMEYLPLYNEHQARRHEVKPGLTGWAQVNGRNAISWEEKFDLDVWYVDNRSTLLDLRIILSTMRSVVKRDGISADGAATMGRFEGECVGPPT